MSRTPVREALQRLQADGLIVRPGSASARIVKLDAPGDHRTVHRANWPRRRGLARRALCRRCRHQLHAPAPCWRRNPSAISPPAWPTTSNCTGRSTSVRAIAYLHRAPEERRRCVRWPATPPGDAGRTRDALTEHRAIIDAIENRDADLAENAAARTHPRLSPLRARQPDRGKYSGMAGEGMVHHE